ncbi:MAG: prolipoprotein diacylglyceryl transferase [Gemmatimonadetes bacterium]|nr:prolipoprotein diacylglyceryl transferase [Gemmatimonadota bacterium]
MYPIFFRLPSWLPFMAGEPITSFGVFMFLSFLVGGMLLRSEMERTGHDPERAWDLVFMAVLGGVIGAKVYYVLLNYEALLANPFSAIFSRTGLVWYGGFAGALLLIVFEIKRRALPLGQMADLCAPTLAIGYAVGRMGCFLVGDDYGRPTGSWVGIKFPNGTPPTRVDFFESYFGVQVDPALVERFGQVVPVHPTQLYEIAMASLIFLVLWKLRVHEHAPGWLFWVCLTLLSVERFLVEFVRVKDDRLFGPLTLAQGIAIALVIFGLWWVRRAWSPTGDSGGATA